MAGAPRPHCQEFVTVTDAPTTAPDQTQETPPTLPEALLARLDALGVEHEDHSHPPLFTVEDQKRCAGNFWCARQKPLPSGQEGKDVAGRVS